MPFQKASKKQAKARIGLIGPSGSGKTYTALTLATGLGEKIAVIDTEHGSASKYADKFEFDVLELDNFHPQKYIDAIKEAGALGYDVLIIDSLSHAWAGTDGALELADKNSVKYGGNKFAAWRDVTPLHNKLVEAIITSPCHVIATMRAKIQYIQTQDDKGKTIIKKVGLEPIQRDGMEYEFDIVADMDIDHNLIISKTRCDVLDGLIINKPNKDLAETINAWLTDGAEMKIKRPITQEQIEKVKNLQQEKGLSKEELKIIATNTTGKHSLKEMNFEEAEKFIKAVKEYNNFEGQ
ncbi:MAG: ATP-binding protein [Caloramator sp.]|nr:ATP-binding protein [Caloramator sp.]